jgi:two-component system, chemotaxis family, chemotaxis protein CheY
MIDLPQKLKDLNFLIVDDYESMQIMISQNLKQLGITKIQICNSGNSALKKIKESISTPNEIEYVITDLVMENGTGLELVQALRAEPKTAKLPIIMVTSKAEVANVIECIKAGVSSYIVKPWELEDLCKKLVESYK